MTVFELVAKLTLDSKEYEDDLKKQAHSSDKLAGAWGKFSKVAKAGAVAISAASAAVGALTKKSIDAYAEYEQLSGGIRKLYEDGADDLLNYAQQAYRTSGMSTNAYIQNVTGFSAALLNSVEGDSKEAARVADMAMQDIADNANTFGKYTAEELAGVYQALAKGQFQTLDNLNLGYGGSKEGMQSLIDKANELAKAQGMAGDLTIDSYADIVQAIHLVQDDLNITGTTQAEAAKTIQGALQMTKAAWDNLVAGFADPDADMGQLMDNLIVAIVGDKEGEGLLNQLIPAVERAVQGIGQFIQGAIPVLAKQLPNLIQSFLPVLIQSAVSLVASLIKALPDVVSLLIEMLPDIVDTVINGIVDALIEALPVLIKEAPKLVLALAKGLLNSMKSIRSAGDRLIASLGDAISDAMSALAKRALGFARRINNSIKNGLGSLVSAGGDLISGLWNGIKAKFDGVISRVKALASKLPEAVKKVLGIASPSKVFMEVGKWIPEGLALGIEKNMGAVRGAMDIMSDATSFTPLGSNIGGTINNGGDITINLNYNASDDANDMLRDLSRGVQRYRMAGAI